MLAKVLLDGATLTGTGATHSEAPQRGRRRRKSYIDERPPNKAALAAEPGGHPVNPAFPKRRRRSPDSKERVVAAGDRPVQDAQGHPPTQTPTAHVSGAWTTNGTSPRPTPANQAKGRRKGTRSSGPSADQSKRHLRPTNSDTSASASTFVSSPSVASAAVAVAIPPFPCLLPSLQLRAVSQPMARTFRSNFVQNTLQICSGNGRGHSCASRAKRHVRSTERRPNTYSTYLGKYENYSCDRHDKK